ncbi:MAG: hypothetical protein ACRD4K_02335 [Candidatus Acidiferrales bacterium]
MEWALAISSVIAFAWLVRYYFAAPEHHDLRRVFGVPVLYLYLQTGLLFVKRVVVEWRTPAPQAQAAEYLQVREETRKYYLLACDGCRAAAAAGILFWPVVISTSPEKFDRVFGIWFGLWLAISVAATVWVELKRKQLVELSMQARPVKLPDFMRQSEIARWPVCYQPAVPMLMLKGSRGYSLNLANHLAHLGAAYLIGLVALFALLPKHH